MTQSPLRAFAKKRIVKLFITNKIIRIRTEARWEGMSTSAAEMLPSYWYCYHYGATKTKQTVLVVEVVVLVVIAIVTPTGCGK